MGCKLTLKTKLNATLTLNDIIDSGVITITGINYKNSYMPECVLYKRNDLGEESRDGYIQAKHLKLLLNPLSSLTKPITVSGYNNGKEFVPMVELQKIEPEYPLMIDEGNVFFQDACELNMLEITRIKKRIKKVLDTLYSWHFAIDLPEGTWIDINTIKK
jgi:hypothetical protein